MTDTGQPSTVKASYNFKGSNNDELCFNKGDVITVTQVVEGGWWEGTLNGKTGWFPSNYVKEIKTENHTGPKSPTKPSGEPLLVNRRESMLFYHNVVLSNLIDTERMFVGELQKLLQNYLRPLNGANILGSLEYCELCGNLEDIAALHKDILTSLDACAKMPLQQQRIGGTLIEAAPRLKTLYHVYCANHPKAVAVLQRRREELNKYMESKGAANPGIMLLTTSLSKPFTRLDRYPSLLKELERHTDESHPDRGDTQRAICVFRDIAMSCNDVRKQKELEYEIMNSIIKGWEGEDITHLGEVVMLSHVRIHADNGEKKERLLLLFPGLLVMLSISPRMSGYVFEGKFPVSGMTVKALEDTESYNHAIEMTGSMIDRRVVCCASTLEQRQWIECLEQQIKLGPLHLSTKPQSLQISSSQPSISTVTQAKTAQVTLQGLGKTHNSVWMMSCLRPCPPLRPTFFLQADFTKSPRGNRKGSFRKKPERAHSEEDYYSLRRNDCRTLQDDALLLKVIEAYCTSAKTRHTVNSSILDSPQMLIAEEEKIIIEEMKGDQTVVEEKTLVDTVYQLKDQVKDLKQDQKKMRKDLEDERRARKKLENLLRKSLKSLIDTSAWDEGSPA